MAASDPKLPPFSLDDSRGRKRACPSRRPQAAAEVVPARVLVKEVNWLGDLVMSGPALRAMRRAWPAAHLAILIKRELAGFFDGAQWIDEVIPYSVARGVRGIADRARIVAAIRSARFGLAVLFPNSFSSALWVAMAGVRRRAGYARNGRGALLTDKSAPAKDATGGHQVHYWLAMVRDCLGIEGDPGDFKIEVHEPHRAGMRQWLAAHRRRPGKPLIAIAPAAAYGPAKEWPQQQYSALVDLLAHRFGAECVLVGAPGERAKCAEVARGAKHGAMVAAGETGVGELVAMLSECDGFAGNDSGCMHVAGALGIPTVAIFGSTDPGRTGPLGPRTRVLYRALECSPCLARTCRFGHYNCLTLTTPEEVAESLSSLGAAR